MSNDIRIHIVTKADLRSEDVYAQWDDPETIGRMAPEKRVAVLANPLSHRDDDPVQLIGTNGRRIIGKMDVIPGEIMVRGKTAPILWASTYTVSPKARNTMLGLMLPLHFQRLSPTVGACGASRMSYPIFTALKWVDLSMTRFLLLRNSAPVVQRYLGVNPVASVCERIANVALSILGRYVTATIRRHHMAGFTVHRVDRMPEALAIQISKTTATVSCHRSITWVNWLVENTFNYDSRSANLLYLVEDRSGTVVGYVLAKERYHDSVSAREFKHVRLGSIQDWRSFDPALGDADIALAGIAALCENHVDAIEVCTNDQELVSAVTKLGFLRSSVLHMQFRPSQESPVFGRDLREPAAWRIRPAEGDYYFF